MVISCSYPDLYIWYLFATNYNTVHPDWHNWGKLQGKRFTLYPVIINQNPYQPNTPPHPQPNPIPLVKNGLFCPNITQASICGHIIKYQDDFLDLKVFDDTWSIPRTNQLTDLRHPGCISGAECALKRNKEISNDATILVLGLFEFEFELSKRPCGRAYNQTQIYFMITPGTLMTSAAADVISVPCVKMY